MFHGAEAVSRLNEFEAAQVLEHICSGNKGAGQPKQRTAQPKLKQDPGVTVFS